MRTLLLTSTGMKMNIKEQILKILTKPADQTKLAHIITASKTSKDTGYLKKDRKRMEKAGFQVEDIDIEGKTEKELQGLLRHKDIIYVQGGNTFYLLDRARKSGFDKVVKNLISKGVIYIGVSAGTIITGPTIETAGWKNVDRNIIGLKDLSALNLVPFNFFVHYTDEWQEAVREGIKKSKHPLRILTDEQAILVRGREVKFVGRGKEIKL